MRDTIRISARMQSSNDQSRPRRTCASAIFRLSGDLVRIAVALARAHSSPAPSNAVRISSTRPPANRVSIAALRKGDLKFRLNGYKLKGSWVIVKTRGYGGAPNSWLLIKHKDDWSGPIDIVEFAPLSLKTPNADFAQLLQ